MINELVSYLERRSFLQTNFAQLLECYDKNRGRTTFQCDLVKIVRNHKVPESEIKSLEDSIKSELVKKGRKQPKYVHFNNDYGGYYFTVFFSM